MCVATKFVFCGFIAYAGCGDVVWSWDEVKFVIDKSSSVGKGKLRKCKFGSIILC